MTFRRSLVVMVVILSTVISFKLTFWIYTYRWGKELIGIVLKDPPKYGFWSIPIIFGWGFDNYFLST